MADVKIKPSFTMKPKFAAPIVSPKDSFPKEQVGREKRQYKESMPNDCTTKEPQIVSSTSVEEMNKSTDQKEKISPVKPSLSNSQYEDLFSSITTRILSGDLQLNDTYLDAEETGMKETEMKLSKKPHKKQARKSKENKMRKITEVITGNGIALNDELHENTVTVDSTIEVVGNEKDSAANTFSKSVSNKSPNLSKRNNEVTPLTSPLDESEEKVLLKQPKPKKEKKPKYVNAGKRKSLGYEDEQKGEEKEISVQNSVTKEQHSVQKGIWVQCESCDKWRFLSDCNDPATLPEHWTCYLNPEERYSSCSAEEADWEDKLSQEDFVYSKFTPGSIVWAKMAGYPSWPAMVDTEPDSGSFYESFPDGTVSHYHVVFLDDRVSRAWIGYRYVEAYRLNETPVKLMRSSRHGFKKEIEIAQKQAEEALRMTISDRLNMFGFEKRYNGKSNWGSDKNTIERKQRRKKMKSSSQSQKKSSQNSQKSCVEILEKSGTRTEAAEEEIAEKIPTNLEEHVSESELEDDEAYWNKAHDEENILFSEMVIDEKTEQDKLKMDNGGIEEKKDESIKLDPDIFSMELKEQSSPDENPLDLSQKRGLKAEQEKSQTMNDVALDLSGKNSKSGSQLNTSQIINNDFWGVPEQPTSSEVLFQDVDMHMEEGGASEQELKDVNWDEFEEMVID